MKIRPELRRAVVFALTVAAASTGAAAADAPTAILPPVLAFTVRDIDGEEVPLARYSGKVLLVVNTPGDCRRMPQFAALQDLHDRYDARGLRVLAFPSDDFGGGQSAANAEIKDFLLTEYGIGFDLFEKSSLTGPDAAPLFAFLADERTNPRFFGPLLGNFENFLVARDGRVVSRFRSEFPPDAPEVVAAIEWALLDDAGRAAARADGMGPPALNEYRGREIARTMHWQGAPWLLRETREDEERASVMLRELGLKPGMRVADVGSGNGYHTLRMAEMIAPDGIAYAVDVQPEMLAMLEKRAGQQGITNVKTITNSFWDAELPDAGVDLVLLADVYHEFSHPEEMLASIRRGLRPGGRVALLEFRSEDPDVPIKKLHKMSKEQILREFEPNGFRLVRAFDKLPWQHLMIFEATGGQTPDNPQPTAP